MWRRRYRRRFRGLRMLIGVGAIASWALERNYGASALAYRYAGKSAQYTQIHIPYNSILMLLAGVLFMFIAVKIIIGRKHARATANLAEMLALSPGAFEAEVGRLLKSQGYHLKVCGGAGDKGADLIGTNARGQRVVVQVKRYAETHAIGSPVIQTLIGTQQIFKAQEAIIATTSHLTKAAAELAESQGVVIYDGARLGQLAAKTAA